MSDRSYYPVGAYDDPNAPYNQSGQDNIDINVEISISLSNSASIITNDYVTVVEEDYDVDIDEYGHRVVTGGKYETYDFSDSNLISAYQNDDCYILNLLESYAKILEKQLQDVELAFSKTKEKYKGCKIDTKTRLEYRSFITTINTLKRKIKACRGFIVDDIQVFKE